MDDAIIISEYSLEQAIADGVLVEWQKDDWQALSDGKPIVVTSHLFEDVSLPDLHELWDKYAEWRRNSKDTLPEEDQMFVTVINGNKVWVDETDWQITMLYPEDY